MEGEYRLSYDEDGHISGIEAVIDKDLAGEKLAESIGADLFMILTDVDKVFLHFGTNKQKGLKTLRLEQAKKYLKDGHFPSGSMGPKVEACIRFIEYGGERSIITCLDCADDALDGKEGTHILPNNNPSQPPFSKGGIEGGFGSSMMKIRHVLEAQQFNKKMLKELFTLAGTMERIIEKGGSDLLQGRILASLFYVPSNRTRFSFESAMIRLGGQVLSTDMAESFSSELKGGSLEETIRTSRVLFRCDRSKTS